MKKGGKNIVNLLKKAKGQLEAIEKMVCEQRETIEIIIQINAVRGALTNIAVELIKDETGKCMNCGDLNEQAEKFNKMVEELLKRL